MANPELNTIVETLEVAITKLATVNAAYAHADHPDGFTETLAARDVKTMRPETNVSEKLNRRRVEIGIEATRARTAQLLTSDVHHTDEGPFTTDARAFRGKKPCKIKYLQRAFEHPADHAANAYTIQGLILDPRTLDSSRNALDLKSILGELPDPEITESVARIRFYVAHLGEIKNLLDELQPLHPLNTVSTRIGTPPGRLLIHPSGHLIKSVTREDHNRPGRISFSKVGLDEAERMLDHIMEGYREEVNGITAISIALRHVLENTTQEALASPQTRAEIRNALLDALKELKECRNSIKKHVRLRIETAFEEKDLNSDKAQESLRDAMRYLEIRMEDTENIAAIIAKDMLKVRALTNEHTLPSEAFIRALHKKVQVKPGKWMQAHQGLRILNLNEPMTVDGERNTLNNLETMRKELGGIKLEPYRTLAQKCITEIDNAARELKTKNSPTAATAFIRLVSLVKIAEAHKGLRVVYVDIRRDLEKPERINVKTIQDKLRKIHETLRVYDKAPNENIAVHINAGDDMNAAYIELYKHLETLASLAGTTLPEPPHHRKKATTTDTPKNDFKHKTQNDGLLAHILKKLSISAFIKKTIISHFPQKKAPTEEFSINPKEMLDAMRNFKLETVLAHINGKV